MTMERVRKRELHNDKNASNVEVQNAKVDKYLSNYLGYLLQSDARLRINSSLNIPGPALSILTNQFPIELH